MTITKQILTFFLYAVVAISAQNAIFTRALGVSRLVNLVDSGDLEVARFGLLLTAVQLISSALSYGVNLLLRGVTFTGKSAFLPLLYVLCSTLACFLVMFALSAGKRGEGFKKSVKLLPMATFNCCILGTMLLTNASSYTFANTMGFALGSSGGYVLAAIAVSEGQRKIQNRSLPSTFRGIPITLIYIGILALAIYGFTGHMPAI